MSPLEQELAALRRDVELTNSLVAQMVAGHDSIVASINTLVQALTAPGAGVDPQLKKLETLIKMVRKLTEMVASLLGRSTC